MIATTSLSRRHRPQPTAPSRSVQRSPGRAISQTSPLLDANRAAKLLAVPPSWLLAQARANTIPHHRLGHYVRFDEDELIQWVADSQLGPSRGARRP